VAKNRQEMNIKILNIIKKNILIGIECLKSALPVIHEIDDDSINGKNKLK